MQLSKKQITFLNFFVRFWNLDEILNTFLKKDYSDSLCILEFSDWEDVVR